uniref:Receptor kinase-like protein Xa21 n=3 Tax=Hordeum vulgare subsp. vulgare TaxID=112509 RepID=A0A8I6YYP4_HORVV
MTCRCGCDDAVNVVLNPWDLSQFSIQYPNSHFTPQHPEKTMQERPPSCATRHSKGNGGHMSANLPWRLTMLMLLSLLLISCGVRNARCSIVPSDNSMDMLWLLDFKAATDDPTQSLSSWNSSIPHCLWKGVNCSLAHPGRVTALNLTRQTLQGKIAPSLGNLTLLTTLILSSNGFFGQLPTHNRLHRLQYLELGNNKLQGFNPDALRNCSNLSYLDLSFNLITSSLPPNIGSLSSLVQLDLAQNSFFGIIPPSIQNITKLKFLALSNNQIEGNIPVELGHLPDITMLLLGGNMLSGRIPRTLLNNSALSVLDLNSNFLQMKLPSNIGDTLPNLIALQLQDNMFEGKIPASLGNASFLFIIQLSYNNLTGQIPTSFGNLRDMTYLELDHNKLDAKDNQGWKFLDALSNCGSLQVLGLNDNHLNGAIPNSVGNLSTSLKELGFHYNYLSGTVPEGIRNLTGLTMLLLDHNNLTGPIGTWVGNFKNLSVVSLSDNKFTGLIPSSIGSLAQLTELFFSRNNFEGPIPPSLGNLPFLLQLDLSNNSLQGHIPNELFSRLSGMTNCIISYNNLDGPIPPEVSNLKQLTKLDLSSNKLSGQIPVTLGECQGLEILLVDNNFLSGNIPKSMSGLKSLSMLNLSHNNLSGSIATELSNLPYLTQLDLSYNNLQGEIPRDGVFRNATATSVEGNWGLCGGAMDLHMPMCPTVSRKSETEYYLVRALIPLFGFMSLIMLTYVIFFGKKTSQRTYTILLSFGKKFPRVAYNDLAGATGNFSELNLVGRGSYGSVYRGKLTQAKIQVAIKVFDLDMKFADKSFVTECEVLCRIRHRNLVPILTACSTIDNKGDPFKSLIYEFMPNGNLDTWLHNKYLGSSTRCLSLAQRTSTAIGIADALAYLHNDCERQIAHCDLKPTNILLDDDMNAYLGDFGIASLIGHSTLDTSMGLKGTIGYIAPEYGQSGQASTHGDVYSFGIVLLEMLIGKRPTADPMFENELNMVNFVQRSYPDKIHHIIDARLSGECKIYIRTSIGTENAAHGCVLSLMQVALSCTRLIPRERMSIREVANKLHSIQTLYIRETKREQVLLR